MAWLCGECRSQGASTARYAPVAALTGRVTHYLFAGVPPKASFFFLPVFSTC